MVKHGVKNIVYTVVYDNIQYYYVGGNFHTAGGVQANNIARYDIVNEIWEPLIDTTTQKNGVDGTVYTIYYDNTNSLIYTGGSFLKVSGKNYYNIASWDGNTWNSVGTNRRNNGTNGTVFTIIKNINSNYLYVGGKFNSTDYDGITISSINKFHNLASWDGIQWNYVGSSNVQNGTNDTVLTLYYDTGNNRLYVGGEFTQVNYSVVLGPTYANYIAIWDGNNWNAIGNNGTNSFVNTITGNNSGSIYIGGKFTIVDYGYGANNLSANHIVMWNGSWISLQDSGNSNNGLNGVVNTLYYDINNNVLYVGGLFTYAYLDTITTKGPYYNSVKWNLNANIWEYIGISQEMNGVNGEVFSIFNNIDNNTFIAGTFNLASYDGTNGQFKVQNITYFDGSNWNPLNYSSYSSGVSTKEVFALAVIDDDIYVGGSFEATAPTFVAPYNICNYIARWSTIHEVWYPLIYYNGNNGEIGLNGAVRALSTNGTLLFVGGNFTHTNENTLLLNYRAIWDSTLETWTRIIGGTNPDFGLNGPVLGLSCRFPYKILYISGEFIGTENSFLLLEHIASFDLINVGTSNGFQQIIDSNGNVGTNAITNTILDVYPRVYFGGEFTNVSPILNLSMNYLVYYLYIYISPEVILNISDPPRQFLDTQTGIISSTYTLTNRFKSVILINCQEENISPLTYWLIMYRS